MEWVHQMFAKQAARVPEQVAVSADGQWITYGELYRRSTRLANSLLARGLGPGETAAIRMERGIGLVTAILGVLQAGGSLLTIDPSYPQERVDLMLEDVSPRSFLTEANLEELLAAGHEQAPNVPRNEQDLIYIIYTSGSTGRPKGVMAAHGAVSHFIDWEREQFSVREGDRVSQFTSQAFEPFMRDLFLPLCSGATLCIPPHSLLQDGASLLAWLEAEEISLVHCVPSLFRQILHALKTTEGAAERLPRLRAVMMVGEALQTKLVKQWRETMGSRTKLYNFYSPTEATMVKVCHPVVEQSLLRKTVPVGEAIPDAELLVLDEEGRECGICELGELAIASRYLALGYYKRPDLTEQAFTQWGERRLYRTGDLGRRLPDGEVEYVGRKDDQVKVRGHRVEPGDLSAVISEHPSVELAVVLPRKRADGEADLLAFFTASQAGLTADEMHSFLKKKVPSFLMPAQMHLLDEWPLTANGKVDRDRLRDIAADGRALLRNPYEDPKSLREQEVAGVFAEVLGVPQVGRSDNFFYLGGHSLLALSAVDRLIETSRARISIQDLLAYPTVKAMAGHIELLVIAGQVL